jgi:glycosyltransferase involved in cell wall biosynthesis
MKPLVSILIPAFNAEEWIADTLDSALKQTWTPKEIIVVDDGSTDRTLSIAQRFASRELTVVAQNNQGAAAARNRAYALSHGDYIQWLDADDLLAPDKIAMQMEVLDDRQSKRTLLSSAWGGFLYRTSRATFTPTALWCDLSPAEWLLRKMSQNLFMQTATWLVSRELTEISGPWDARLFVDDDGEYFCRVLLASDRVRFVAESKVLYRVSGSGSLSYIGQSDKKLEAQFLSMQLHIQFIRSLEESARVRAACIKYLETWFPYFYPERPEITERMRQLAVSLGGQLDPPRLSWKYAWVKMLFGWTAAKRVQLRYNRFKLSMLRSWDKALFLLEKRNLLNS